MRFHSLRRKTLFLVFIIGMLTSAMAVLISYMLYSENTKEHYNELAVNLSKTLAVAVDHEEVKKYSDAVYDIYSQNPGQDYSDMEAYQLDYSDIINDQNYKNFQAHLADLADASGVDSLYIAQLDAASQTGVYVATSTRDDSSYITGVWDPIYDVNKEVFSNPEAGFAPYVTNTKEYGWLCTAASPIEYNGEVIGFAFVDISMNEIMGNIKRFLTFTSVILFCISLVISLVFDIGIHHTMVKPLTRLSAAAKNFVESKNDGIEGESELQRVKVNTHDELEVLSDSLKQMELDINDYIENIKYISAEKERIGAELNVATRIQADMLPAVFPAFPDRTEFDIYASMDPAKEVGGDFYDFFMIDDTHLALNISDVSGKGVPAALVMVIGKTLIKLAAQDGMTAGQVLSRVNNHLCTNSINDMFITSWLGIVDLTTGVMTCANAGHEYPAIYRKASGAFELFKDKHGLVLGGMEGLNYREYTLDLGEGDKVFVYTDGVPEATDANNGLFGTDRMIEALNIEAGADCKQILVNVRAKVDEFVGEAPQFDDLTMLCFELKKYTTI